MTWPIEWILVSQNVLDQEEGITNERTTRARKNARMDALMDTSPGVKKLTSV